ncbi:hypothetical protein M2475_000854 [Breznakia sp. PF5-3]|uniref:putative ABC exporter domain-containing protein n=1 Tax=unclassified Breznakia TaxID=2623764 RepID=UPI002406FD2D|nr:MULTISPECIES: putative ABC exporter domain-containing protein [unclassified Breznakia]MDF9824503.1 hypothetical protein [Breznakia sp. PM6-1]MDF9835289.1 hypothetical protein [Breznakia sp. PF5-3]
MKNLFKLFFTKKKAKVRSIFAKPSSAIATLLSLLVFASMFFPVFDTRDKPVMDLLTYSLFTLFVIGFSTFLNLITLFQKKKALFFEEDSYYLFVGPFSNRQILSYLSVETMFDSFILSLISIVSPMMIISMMAIMPITYILFAFLITALYNYIILVLLQYFYIKDMIKEKKGNTQRWIGLCIFIILVAYAIYSYFQSSFNFTDIFVNFTYTNDFDFIPILGWIKTAMFGFYQNDTLIVLIVVAAFIVIDIILAALLTHVKGYFYEQAMIDAIDFSDYYKKAMAGIESKEEKIHDVTINYKQLSGAILSKNFLIMKKTRSFIGRQDLYSFIALAVFTLMINPNVYVFFGLLIFYLMNSVGNSTLSDDLKNNYIYFIPDKPIKKMLYSLLIPALKSTLFAVTMILIGFIFVDLKLTETLIGILITLSFIPVFYAGVVLSTRLLKSRGNKLIESMLHMLVMVVICLPSGGIAYLAFKMTGDFSQTITVLIPTLIVFNLALSLLIFYICSPMMNGNAYAAE